jgi:hypothetical protein
LGRPAGGALFVPEKNPGLRLHEIREELATAFAALREERRRSVRQLDVMTKGIADLVEQVEAEIKKLAAPLDLFRTNGIDRLAQWMNAHDKTAVFKSDARRIIKRGDLGDREVACPITYSPPSIAFVQSFRRLMIGEPLAKAA